MNDTVNQAPATEISDASASLTNEVSTAPAITGDTATTGDTTTVVEGSETVVEAPATDAPVVETVAAASESSDVVTPPAPPAGAQSHKGGKRHNRNKGKPNNDSTPPADPLKVLESNPAFVALRDAKDQNRRIEAKITSVAEKKDRSGKVIGVVGYRGEYTCEGATEALPLFLPMSEMQHGVKQDQMVGLSVGVKVLELQFNGPKLRSAVVSRRKAIASEARAFLKTLVPSDEVEYDGVVTGDHEHGYFVSIPSAGPLPVMGQTWLSKGQVPFGDNRTPIELTKNQAVRVRIMSNNEGKVAVTMRKPRPEGSKPRGDRPQGNTRSEGRRSEGGSSNGTGNNGGNRNNGNGNRNNGNGNRNGNRNGARNDGRNTTAERKPESVVSAPPAASTPNTNAGTTGEGKGKKKSGNKPSSKTKAVVNPAARGTVLHSFAALGTFFTEQKKGEPAPVAEQPTAPVVDAVPVVEAAPVVEAVAVVETVAVETAPVVAAVTAETPVAE
jgi:hypothetical protein